MNGRMSLKVTNKDVRQSFYKAEVLIKHRNLLHDVLWSKFGFASWMFFILKMIKRIKIGNN